MKSISLMESEVKQLLEMCRHFYPDYVDIFQSTQTPGLIIFFKEGFGKKAECQSIHWFELCINHLLPNIQPGSSDLLRKKKVTVLLIECLNSPSIMIGKLHREFEKLKKAS